MSSERSLDRSDIPKGALAQLARVQHWQCWGQGFDSLMLHHFFALIPVAQAQIHLVLLIFSFFCFISFYWFLPPHIKNNNNKTTTTFYWVNNLIWAEISAVLVISYIYHDTITPPSFSITLFLTLIFRSLDLNKCKDSNNLLNTTIWKMRWL